MASTPVDLDSDEEESEGSPVESDEEAEYEEVKETLAEMADLVTELTRKLGELEDPSAAEQRKRSIPIEIMLRAKRLLQNPEAAMDEITVTATPLNLVNAASSQTVGNAATGQLPQIPQAQAFREEKGYKDFNEVRDGLTLIDWCCTEFLRRT